MVPVYKKNYLVSFIRPNPDLYGRVQMSLYLSFFLTVQDIFKRYVLKITSIIDIA